MSSCNYWTLVKEGNAKSYEVTVTKNSNDVLSSKGFHDRCHSVKVWPDAVGAIPPILRKHCSRVAECLALPLKYGFLATNQQA